MSLSTPSTSRVSQPPKRPNLNDFDSYWVRDPDPPAQKPFDFQVEQISDNYCRVCGDITANRFYGVVTCKNCQTFFQQRKANRTTIRCLSGFRQPCVLYSKTQMCQFCRFNKCVEVGLDMRKGWFPRILLGQAPDLPSLCQRQRKTDIPAEAMQEVDSNEKPDDTLDDNTDPNRLEIWILLSHFLDKDISATIQWIPSQYIENIPDICAVLRRQLFPMLLIQWTRALTDRNGLQLHDGTILGCYKLKIAFGVALAENMLIFANDLRSQQFTDEELMMYACLVFLQPIQPDDPLRAELHDPDVFGEHYYRYYKWFMKYVFHHHFGIDKLNYAVTLLMPHLNAMNELFQNEVRSFLIQNKHHLLGKVPNGFYSIFVEPTNTPSPSPRGNVALNGRNGRIGQVARVAQVAHDAQVAHVAQNAENAQNRQNGQIAQKAQVAQVVQNSQKLQHSRIAQVAQNGQVAHDARVAQAAQVVITLEDDDSDIEIIEEAHPEPAPAPQKPKRKRNKRKNTPEN
ncbi:unnamed protein product [Caenorhabditis brenneri]